MFPSFSVTDKVFNEDGEKQDTAAEETITTMSGAFEIGVMDPVTFGIK